MKIKKRIDEDFEYIYFFKDAFIDATGNPPPFDSQGNPIEDNFMDIEHTWHNEQEI
jgi:hypothetical protein